jgi:branched-subunit amino acid transport protein
MNRNDSLLIIVVLLMALVTYLPRVLPLVALHRLRMPPFLRRQLELIPYAVLGALIFPGVLTSTGTSLSAAAGTAAAALLSLLRANLLFVVIGSIAAVYAVDLLLSAR